MGVYIKGMEMPKKCNDCPLHFYLGQAICSCRALPAIDDDEVLKPWKKRRKDCPLVEMKDGCLYGVKDGVLYEAMLKDPSKGAKTLTVNLPSKEEAE